MAGLVSVREFMPHHLEGIIPLHSLVAQPEALYPRFLKSYLPTIGTGVP